ncbi:hypothetical protein E2C01_073436 [Portunus trituberculatus]|uniref:Uncharacterized protein n=1 Tax=Portunus trituberculatus TaxID=210409 RepID=A0A5B7IDJ3_PORTR|nr:hypothetical protein [Portunus trituberculatus]
MYRTLFSQALNTAAAAAASESDARAGSDNGTTLASEGGQWDRSIKTNRQEEKDVKKDRFRQEEQKRKDKMDRRRQEGDRIVSSWTHGYRVKNTHS